MSELGDIFGMFSQNADRDKKKCQGQNAKSQDNSNAADPKSLIISKVLQTKTLLITLEVAGILIICTVSYFLFGYLNDLSVQGIIDNVKPYTQ